PRPGPRLAGTYRVRRGLSAGAQGDRRAIPLRGARSRGVRPGMTRRRVALATYSKLPGLALDDHPLVPALAALGIATEPVVWDDEARWWNGFDAVVVRSCWD